MDDPFADIPVSPDAPPWRVDPSGYIGNAIGAPVTITSGHRDPQHNAAVHGVPNSGHLGYDTFDFQPQNGISYYDAAQRLADSGLDYDQIELAPDHVHVQFGGRNRRQVVYGGGYQGPRVRPQSGPGFMSQVGDLFMGSAEAAENDPFGDIPVKQQAANDPFGDIPAASQKGRQADPGYLAQTIPALTETVTGGIPFLESLTNPIRGAEEAVNQIGTIAGRKQQIIPDEYLLGNTQRQLDRWAGAVGLNPEDVKAPTPGERAYREAVTLGASALVPGGGEEGVLAAIAKGVPIAALSGAAGSLASEYVPDNLKSVVNTLVTGATGIGGGLAAGRISGERAPEPTEGPAEPAAPAPQAPRNAPPAPTTGDVIGLRMKSGPPQRAVVGDYFDDGNAVQLHMDDGSTLHINTSELRQGLTTPPPPLRGGEVPQPADYGVAPTQQEREAFDLAGPYQPPPQRPQNGELFDRQARLGLDMAAKMRADALNPTINLTAAEREAKINEAARLTHQYGFQPTADQPRAVPPPDRVVGAFPPQEGEFVSPPWEKPATGYADLGALDVARKQNPDIFQGDLPPRYGTPLTDDEVRNAASDVAFARKPPSADPSLFDAIRSLGGIKLTGPEGSEIGQALTGYKNPPFKTKLINPQGMTPHYLLQALQERGWFGDYDQTQLSQATAPGDFDALRDLIGREAGGDKVYHPQSQTPANIQHLHDIDRETTEAGVTGDMPTRQAARRLAEYRRANDLTRLKQEANDLGIDYHPDWSAEDLRAEIDERHAMRDEFRGVEQPGDMFGDQTKTPEFQRWFGKSVVTDSTGKPITVYRGEHGAGEGEPETKLGSLTFGSREAANTYAQHPNNRADTAIAPKVIPAHLRIERPFVNDPQDPFLDMSRFDDALGRAKATQIALTHANALEHTNNWEENYAGKYANVADLLRQNPDAIRDLYGDAYKFLDDPSVVRDLKGAGFDGAIHGGNGETAGEPEYRVFDPGQVKSAIGNSGAFDPTNPNIARQPKQEDLFGNNPAETPEERKERLARATITRSQQLPRAVPKKPQRPLDEGLFGEKPQDDLFKNQQGEKFTWKGDEPRFTKTKAGDQVKQLDNQYERYVQHFRTLDTPAGRLDAAYRFLIDRGNELGTESLVAHTRDGTPFSVTTIDNPVAVNFAAHIVDAAQKPGAGIILQHNHPNNISLSGPDVSVTAYPGIDWMVAVGHDGHFFAVRPTEKTLSRFPKDNMTGAVKLSNQLARAYDKAKTVLKSHLMEAIVENRMTASEAGNLWPHAIMEVLRHTGIVDYRTSRPMAANETEALNRALANHDYQPTEPVGYQETMAGILGQHQEAAERAGSNRGAEGSGQSDLFSQGVSQPEDEFRRAVPDNMGAAADKIDNTADAIADAIRGAPPGTYARAMQRMAPPDGREIYKDINAVEHFTVRPRVVASMDTMSGRFYNNWRQRDFKASTLLASARSYISDNFLPLTKAQRDRVYAMEELHRINNIVPKDNGYALVDRNTKDDTARFSQPGQTIRLTPKETKAYFERRQMFDHIWSNLMQGTAQKLGWNKPLGDDMDAAIQEIRNDAQSATAPYQRKNSERIADILTSMEAQRRQAYVPLMRYGDYYISVRPKRSPEEAGVDNELGGYPELKWFELAERAPYADLLGGKTKTGDVPKYAQPRIDALKQQFPDHDIEHGWLYSNPDVLRTLDIPAIDKFLMVTEGGLLNRLRDEEMMGGTANKKQAVARAQQRYDEMYSAMIDAMRTQMYEELKAGFKKRSRTVPGYSPDFDRTTGAYMNWSANHTADLMHRDAIEDSYNALQTLHPYRSTRQYWEDWRAYMERPSNILSRLGSGAANAGFMYTLAGNPSSSAIIGLHAPEMSLPNLSVGAGMGRASATFANAGRQVIGAWRGDLRSGLYVDHTAVGRNAGEKAAVERAANDGLLKSIATEEMAGLGRRQSNLWSADSRDLMRRAANLATSNISLADQTNRLSTFLTAYRMASNPQTFAKMDKAWQQNQLWRDTSLRQGKTPETFARFMLSEGAGEFGKVNQAQVMRGPVGQAFFLLHGFQTQYLSTMYKLMTRMGPEGKVAFAWMLGALTTGAGVQGVPFVQDAENAADAIVKGLTGKDPMIAYRMQNALANTVGKTGAEMIMRGPVGSILGVDLADRIGFGDIISREFLGNESFATLPSIFVSRGTAALKRIKSGQPGLGATELLPAALRNPIKASIESQFGQKSAGGYPVKGAGQITPVDTAKKILGFRPVSDERSWQHYDFGKRQAKSKMAPFADPIPGTETYP